MRRRSLSVIGAVLALGVAAAGCGSGSGSGESGDKPIVVGSTLSLTGAFAATGQIHKIAGETFVDRLNANGGLLGRKVEWKVVDDQSDQAKVSQLYERLISQDRVDLIIGPYATPNILSAMAVAQRHSYVMPQHTAVLAPQLTYECQFPAWSISPTPNSFIPNQLFDAMASLPTPPKRIAVLTSQSGSAAFVSDGFADDKAGVLSIAKERGLEVVADVHYPPTTTDWAPIATQVRDADPDLVINNGLGVDAANILQAMAQLNYRPKQMFGLFPAPGPLLALGDASEGMLSVSMFEPNKPTLDKLGPEATEITAEFTKRATAAKLPYTVFETQAAASWNAWEILTGAVTASGGTDQRKMCDTLHQKGADTTFSGHLTFDPKVHNFWPTTQTLKQIQDGDWVTVWPADRAAAPLRGPSSS
ncbi:branched-chain amino acid ABC transporter substrate-binding protein [Acrocarpospora phusangensis]|uniref:Branched-chain amino acid ABC transporter substrate-binding protein n=1 Tax=Acrocarpospora phusangensis TaxID=1070424 RepID=A0A919UHZ7_9ACTN|nr:amino acid ABC transporter substrate-binding protein [Acrocarpospora phusangensis]GIH22594.1 branched-chain amino acid ABC transporter substrate-binding protein [Acrocarpospora phusangensis]